MMAAAYLHRQRRRVRFSSVRSSYLGEGSVVKKRIFRFFARFFDPKFSIYILLLTEPLKKARGQRPNLVNGHESHNHRPSCFFFGMVRSESGFPYLALMAQNSLFQNKTLS